MQTGSLSADKRLVQTPAPAVPHPADSQESRHRGTVAPSLILLPAAAGLANPGWGENPWAKLGAGPKASPLLSPHPSALSRLIYWLSYAIGRSFRAFGFSMTFLPLLAMLLWNLYSMFIVEPENLLAVATPKPEDRSKDSGAKLRYWG